LTPLVPKQQPITYIVDSLSLVLRLRPRFYPVFGSEWTQFGPKFSRLRIYPASRLKTGGDVIAILFTDIAKSKLRRLSGDCLTHELLRVSFQSLEIDAKGYRTERRSDSDSVFNPRPKNQKLTTSNPLFDPNEYGLKLCSTFSVQPPPASGVTSKTVPQV
jgi:hypothetical protein